MTDTPPSCVNCYGSDNVHVRTVDWDLRPRAKDLAKGHKREWTTLDVELCDHCYSFVDEDFYAKGWDWWDAVDGLCELIQQSAVDVLDNNAVAE